MFTFVPPILLPYRHTHQPSTPHFSLYLRALCSPISGIHIKLCVGLCSKPQLSTGPGKELGVQNVDKMTQKLSTLTCYIEGSRSNRERMSDPYSVDSATTVDSLDCSQTSVSSVLLGFPFATPSLLFQSRPLLPCLSSTSRPFLCTRLAGPALQACGRCPFGYA
jgi:hypothetical protein